MRCPCGGDTTVTETRMRAGDTLRRTRKCNACGAGYKTVELRETDLVALERRRNGLRSAQAKWIASLTPDELAERGKRRRLRKAARQEAAETGEPVQAVYERWGCA